MFDLQLPWWEVPARVGLIYVALLLLVRVSGKRTVGQFTPFDLLVVILLSEAVSQGLTGGEQSVTGGLLAALVLVAMNMVVAWLTSRSRRIQHLVEGKAVLIGKDGHIYAEVLKRERVPLADVEQALREADCSASELKQAFLEADGRISILKESRSPE